MDVLVKLGKIHAHSNVIGALLWCHYNWRTPLCGFGYRCNDALVSQEVNLLFECVFVGELDCAWCGYAKQFSIRCEGYPEFLSRHCVHLAIEDCWEFSYELLSCWCLHPSQCS